MDIWLDTCDRQEVIDAGRFGIICGVTTNPSILAKDGEDPEKIINMLLEVQDGPVAVQVLGDSEQEMIDKALALHAFSDKVIVKLPVTQQGLLAMNHLYMEEEVPVMATAVFQPVQALLASLAGAAYVAPYVGRMSDAGINFYQALSSMSTIARQYQFKTKILAAVKTVAQMMSCAELGIDAVTLKPALFKEMIADDRLTLEAIQEFNKDWQKNSYREASLLSL